MQVVHKIQQVIATAALGVAVVAGALLPAQAYGGDLTIAAASDLNFAFKDLVAEYEKKTGERVKLTLGSSGNFYSQIENGAPFDLYFSADIRYPQKLIEGGHGIADSLYKYAVGRIVLWVPMGSALSIDKGLESLAAPSVSSKENLVLNANRIFNQCAGMRIQGNGSGGTGRPGTW